MGQIQSTKKSRNNDDDDRVSVKSCIVSDSVDDLAQKLDAKGTRSSMFSFYNKNPNTFKTENKTGNVSEGEQVESHLQSHKSGTKEAFTQGEGHQRSTGDMINDETNILEFIDNFTHINGRNPRLHELKEQFDGQIGEEFLKKMIQEIYHKNVEDVIDIDV